LQVSIAVFSGAVEKFLGKDGSDPLEKIGPYAYVLSLVACCFSLALVSDLA